MAFNKKAVRTVLDKAIKAGRSALSAAECKKICSAYDIPLPRDGMAASADKAAALAKRPASKWIKVVLPDPDLPFRSQCSPSFIKTSEKERFWLSEYL